MNKQIKICLINRNYPPVPGATGQYSSHLIQYLNENRFLTTIVSTGTHSTKNHIQLKSIYDGKKKWLRGIGSFIESYRLIKTSTKTKSHIYIVLGDPSFLNYWASILLKNKVWIYWTMDVYPLAFVANGLINKTNPVYKHINKTIQNNPPNHLITLGDHQAQFIKQKFHWTHIGHTTIPIGIPNKITRRQNPILKNKLTFAYIGTLGEAHDEDLLFNIIDSLNNRGHKIILRIIGSKDKRFLKLVSPLSNVSTFEYINEESMNQIDVHLVSLLPDWTHISVPSKAISAIFHGSAIFYIGKKESDTWEYVKPIGFNLQDKTKIENVLNDIEKRQLEKRIKNSITQIEYISKLRKNAFTEISSYICDQILTN